MAGYSSDISKKAESVSSFCFASARGLAKLAAYMANKGSLNGRQLISEETWNEVQADPTAEIESGVALTTTYTKGGLNLFQHSSKIPVDPSHPYYVEGLTNKS
jgi:hypothetical protein